MTQILEPVLSCSVHNKRTKKTFGYRERDAEQRQAFLTELAAIDPSDIYWMDECGIDNTEARPCGYAPEGERCHALRPGTRRDRLIGVCPKDCV
jgi:hypothetical protein